METVQDIIIVGGGALGLFTCLNILEDNGFLKDIKITLISAGGGSFTASGGFIPPSSIFPYESHSYRGSNSHFERMKKNIFTCCYQEVNVRKVDVDFVSESVDLEAKTRSYKGLVMDTRLFSSVFYANYSGRINAITGKVNSWKKSGHNTEVTYWNDSEKQVKSMKCRVLLLCPGIGSLNLPLPGDILQKLELNEVYGSRKEMLRPEFFSKLNYNLYKDVLMLNVMPVTQSNVTITGNTLSESKECAIIGNSPEDLGPNSSM